MRPFRQLTATAALALLAALCLATPLHADTAFDDANHAFAEGRFADSVRGYETVLKHDGYSAPVLFDLGNAHLRAGQLGEAILDYERARLLAPRDADIAANLRLARHRAGLSAPDEPWPVAAANLLAPDTWAFLGSAALVALCAGILGAGFRPRRRAVFGLLTMTGAIFLLGSIGAVAVDATQSDRAILPAKDAAALISPFDGAKTVFEFPAGQTVNIEKSHGDYSLVRDAAGHSGWVANAQIGRIVPTATSG